MNQVSQGRFGSLLKKFMTGAAVLCMAVSSFVPAGAQTSENDQPTIYGFLGYIPMSITEPENGLYSIDSKGVTTQIWSDERIMQYGTYISVMWPENGKLRMLYGNKTQYFQLAFDMSTGEFLLDEEKQIDVSDQNAYKYIRRGAYNPNDGYIYGYSWNADESEDYFVKTPASDPSKVEIIRKMPRDFIACSANCFNPEDNCMYGIDTYKSFVRVDVHGNFSYVNLLTPKDYPLHGVVAGLTYSPKEKVFYWNCRYANYESQYVKIDPAKVEIVEDGDYVEEVIQTEYVADFRMFDAFVSLFSTDSTGAYDGPEAAETVSVDFVDDATTGFITYRMPSKLINGNDAPGEMKWTATNGAGVSFDGTAAPGEEVVVNYEDLMTGEYSFTFRAYADDKEGALEVNTMWVGMDVPSVPTDVTFAPAGEKGKYIVKWNPVTKGAHNAFLNPAEIKYIVFLNNELQLATTDKTEVEVEIDSTGEEARYDVSVYAMIGKLISEGGYSNILYIGDGWSLPFTIVPDDDQLEMMTYLNPNGDSFGWRPYAYMPGVTVFYSGRDYNNAADDWLITPHFFFPDAEKTYQLSFDVAMYNQLETEEYYEVWLGSEPTEEGIREKRLVGKTKPMSQTFTRESTTFKVPEAGPYFIGIHAMSDPEMAGIFVKNIEVKEAPGGSGVVGEMDQKDGFLKSVKGGMLPVGLDGKRISIFTLDGRTVYGGTAVSGNVITVAPGIYVAVADGKSTKVIVK